jgi:hypothetical protein
MLGISLVVKSLTDFIVEKISNYYSEENTKEKLIINVKSSESIYKNFGVDKIIIELGQFNEYLHDKSGFNKDKNEYISYLTLNVNNLTVDSLLHEIKHIFVDWCIYKNGGKPIKESKEVKELYTEDFQKILTIDKDKMPNLIKVVRFFYYSTKLEIPSFLENHFFDNNFYYKNEIKKMLDFKVENFKNEKYQEEFNILQSYNIPKFNKFKTYESFLEYCNKFFKIRGLYILKKINKVEYLNKTKENDWIVHLFREHIHNKKLLSSLEWVFIINSLNAKISRRGQWDFPGECTMIPTKSHRITMKNVKYNLLGIDGNGEYKLMKPNGEYKFSHNYVFEIPDLNDYSELIKKIVKKC